MRPDGLLELFLSHPERSEGTRIPELRNGSQIFKKWSEMVLCCWGFHKNVSRETFLVQENEIRIVADAVTVLGRLFSGLFSS
jgi:hypothetical protein